ncbi:hypothetical protein PAMP_013056 [Pampus punctatissimus]
MATSDKLPIPPVPTTTYNTKQAKRRKTFETLEEKRENKKALNQKRDLTRVNIGEAFSRWRELRAVEGLKNDAEVALFLLDSYEKDSLTLNPCKED